MECDVLSNLFGSRFMSMHAGIDELSLSFRDCCNELNDIQSHALRDFSVIDHCCQLQ